VIGTVLPRGRQVGGLLRYLFREGLAGEHGLAADHVAPRLIAAWDGDLTALEPATTAAGGRDVRALAAALNAPLVYANVEAAARPVYHLAIAAAKDPRTGRLLDRPLTDAQWADVATEYLHQIGLAPRGDEQAVRWVAVRHADDHIHVVATLAGQDGRRVFPRNDHYRAREASLTVEARYGLIPTSPAGRTSSRPPTRAEARKHQQTVRNHQQTGRPGPPAPDRLVLRQLVRAAAAGTQSWEEFRARLDQQGVHVRPRMSERTPGQITGYAVALPDRYDTGQTIWFGGGKLAPDLTLPQLQRRWASSDTGTGDFAGADGARKPAADAAAGRRPGTDRFGLTREERQALWAQAQRATSAATDRLRAAADGDPAAAGDAAWAAADLLAAVAHVAEGRRGGPYTDAARTFEQAGREPRGQAAAATRPGRQLRKASAGLLRAGVALPSEQRQLLDLAQRLSTLADAVARLRQTQQRAAQAAAARRTAEQLLTLYATGNTPARTSAPTTAFRRLQGSPHVAGAATSPGRQRRR
jgi:hypothetical protein